MAAARWIFLTLEIFLIFRGSLQRDEQCEFANVHFVNEDGKEQIFTFGVRTDDDVQHLSSCGGVNPSAELEALQLASCSSCGSCTQNSNGQNNLLDATNSAAILVSPTANKLSTSAPGPGARIAELTPTVNVLVGSLPAVCDKARDDLPNDLCCGAMAGRSASSEPCHSTAPLTEEILEHYAILLAEKDLIPMATGDIQVDKQLGYGLLLLASSQYDESVVHFSRIIKENPGLVAAYLGRGMAHARKSLQNQNVRQALADFATAIEKDRRCPEGYARRAELYLPLGKYTEALKDVNAAMQLQATSRLYFVRGAVEFALNDLASAEKDFRRSLEESETDEHLDSDQRIQALYNLALTLYHRGKNRNAIEVFKEVIKLKKDHLKAHLCLAQAYRELGDYQRAHNMFDTCLALDPDHVLTLQLKGSLFYYSGDPQTALQDFNRCLSLEPYNKVCQYMQGLSHTALGQYYHGIKALTKVLVYNDTPTIKVTPEFIKAHYLKEHARYLHKRLDESLQDLKLDVELDGEFRDHWAKLLPFDFETSYTEQPGLQPHTEDVHTPQFADYSQSMQELLCRSQKLGTLTQVMSDGYLPNSRLNLALGLAAIDIAQTMEEYWKEVRNNKHNAKMSWKDVFDIAVQYRRLVDPDVPVLWLDQMPETYLKEGYSTDMHFIRGHTLNLMLTQYSNLVLKLVKSMVTEYKGVGAVNSDQFKSDLHSVDSYEDLIGLAKAGKLEQHGLMLSTQLPSIKAKDHVTHDGIILTLTGDSDGKVLFAMSLATTRGRTESYSSELDYVFMQLCQEIKRNGTQKNTNMDLLMNLVLSLVYYFYNLMPLSRGSSAVAYTVAMGLIMSLGREVTGKIPHAKLVEIEAMMSGAPEAFTFVVKQWMNIRKSSAPVSSLPRVSQVFPTVRHVIEALNLPAFTC